MSQAKLTKELFQPRYWLTWSGILLLFITSLLPYSALLFLGRQLGRAAYPLVKSRRKIAQRNLELCFPELSQAEIEQKVRLNFENSGIALLELGMAWFWPHWRINKLLKISGLEYLQQAQEKGRGIIFLGAHFLTIDVGARALGSVHASHLVYRKHKNPVLDYWFYKGRIRDNHAMVDRSNFKSMLRILKKGEALWYAPDHDYGKHKSSVFAPFFAVDNANTVAGTSKLARFNNSTVIPMFLKRLPGDAGYELMFYPPLENFPTADLEADAQTTNQQIEKMILECDDLYMWMHRRFKTRPEGESSLY